MKNFQTEVGCQLHQRSCTRRQDELNQMEGWQWTTTNCQNRTEYQACIGADVQ